MNGIEWLPLLQRLTAASSTWGLLKDPGGDVDSVGEADEWPALIAEFRRWASEQGWGPVVVCTHFRPLLIAVACAGEQLVQLDVYARQLFRGAKLVDAADLRPLMVELEGYRRLRPGAEGLLALLQGTQRGGRRPAVAAAGRAKQLISDDAQGATALARIIGLPLGTVRQIESDGWNRLGMVRFELRQAVRLLDPAQLGACLRLDYRRLRGCALVEALEHGRRVPGDRDVWLGEIARAHDVR